MVSIREATCLGSLRWYSTPASSIVAGAKVTVTNAKTVLGNLPRRVTAVGAQTISIFGTGFSALDTAAFTTAATCTGVALSAVGFTGVATKVSIEQTISASASHTLCYKHSGGIVKRYASVTLGVSACVLSQCPVGQYLCDCKCQAAECAVPETEKPCADPAKIRCTASGACMRTPALCPAAECAEGLTCPGGECVTSLGECPVAPACASGYKRCLDGSCSKTCMFKSAAIVAPTCTAEQTLDVGSGICYPAGTALPGFNGCPPASPVQCATCTCAASATECPSYDAMAKTWTCLDGTVTTNASMCKCPTSSSKPVRGSKALRLTSRLVVKANAASTINVKDSNGATAATVTLPSNAVVQNSCFLSYGGFADSTLRASAAAQTVAFASPAVALSLVDSVGIACDLQAAVTVAFPTAVANAEEETSCLSVAAHDGVLSVTDAGCAIDGVLGSVVKAIGDATPLETPEEEEEGSAAEEEEEEEGSAPGSGPDEEEEEGDDEGDDASAGSESASAVAAASLAVAAAFLALAL